MAEEADAPSQANLPGDFIDAVAGSLHEQYRLLSQDLVLVVLPEKFNPSNMHVKTMFLSLVFV